MVDIIIFAIVALVIAYRFYSVLGTVDEAKKKSADIIELDKKDVEVKDVKELDELEEKALSGLTVAVKNKIVKIKEKKQDFRLAKFLDNIEKAFEIILESFVKGDKKALESLAENSVAQKFIAEFEALEKAGNRLNLNIVSIISKKIKAVKLTDSKAEIAVLFESEQISYVENEKGEIISGDKNKLEQIEDEWSFVKDLKEPSPVWKLAKTA